MTIAMRGSPAAGGDSPQDPPTSTSTAPPTSTPSQSPPSTTSPTPPVTTTTTTTTDSGTPAPSTSVSVDDSTPVPQEEVKRQIPVQHEESGGAGEGGENGTQEEAEPNPLNDLQEFPLAELAKLDEMISRPRWVVPVLPKGELEILLDAAIIMCKKGLDTQSEACQRFFRDGLTISFTKILTDEAVSGWKYEIHRCIMKNCERLIQLCVIKLDQDWFPLLELLAMVLNPSSKFHTYNGTRQSDTVPNNAALADDELYARCPDSRTPKGWLVDLVNLFGKLNGFEILLERFTNGPNLSVPVVAALIKPFGYCFEVLTPYVVEKYFMPIVKIVPEFLDGLTDEELKKESNEAKNEAKNDALTGIIKGLKYLTWRVPKQEETSKNLEMFRLKMILRLLQISSFNGKMNALNEVNKVLASVTYYSHRHGTGANAAATSSTTATSQIDDDDWLTAEKMAEWIQENTVLDIVLRDSLHQPQYVEKLEKIIRFMIKEKALTLPDLDRIWLAQAGKHEAIVKNVHDLLAKLAWDFTPEQLDHLFECFQGSWVNASKKQREKLLELIRRLAEDDKEGVMANKVLGLLWNLAHSEDVPTEIMDQALTSHIKILDYSCSQDRDSQKLQWINQFVEELKNDKWVLPALKQIREICSLFSELEQRVFYQLRTGRWVCKRRADSMEDEPLEMSAIRKPRRSLRRGAPQNYTQPQRSSQVYYRNRVISTLQKQHSIVMLVAQNLTAYMNRARLFARDNTDVDPADILPDGRFNHLLQVQERLRFLRFLLKDGQLWLCEPQAKQIWVCLAENAIYECDRENCFKWFSKLMGEEPDLDPEITKDFFEQNILQFDPALLTENGMNCFERFFKFTNSKEGKLISKRRGGYMMDDIDLIGMDYLWRVVLYSPDDVAEKGIQLLKDVFTNLGPRLQVNQVEIHHEMLSVCMERLKAAYDTIGALVAGEKAGDGDAGGERAAAAARMIRVLTVLREYVAECDDAHGEERAILPLGRACRGKHVSLVVRFPNQGRQVEDIEVWSHTNDTMGEVRRQILRRVKANNANLKIDLYINGDLLDQSEDRKLISQLNIRDKTLVTAKLSQVGANVPSDPDSSSDSSAAGSPGHQAYDGPNIEAENCLPGVIMANLKRYAEFLFQMADMGSQLEIPKLRECSRQILKIMPADAHTCEVLRNICAEHVKKPAEGNVSPKLEALFFGTSSAQVLYTLEVCYAMLMPAQDTMSKDAFAFQSNFMKSGGVPLSLSMLTKNNFLPNADLSTRRAAYHVVLKIAKLLLTAVGHAQVQLVAEAFQSGGESPAISAQTHNQAVVLQQALHTIPNPNAECMTRSVASKLGHDLGAEIQRTAVAATSPVHKSGSVMEILGISLELSTIKSLQKLAWAASCGQLQLLHASNDDIHAAHESPAAAPNAATPGGEEGYGDTAVCREALELLAVALTLCPQALDALNKDKAWQTFIIDILLLSRSRSIRATGTEQFLLLATKCCAGSRPLLFFITLLFTVLGSTAKEHAQQSHEYFQLLCKLLNYACGSQVSVPTAEALLNNEIQWLKSVRDAVLKSGGGGSTGTAGSGDGTAPDEALLEGHLGVTRELLAFQPPEKKYYIGCQPGGINLIKEVIDDFIFPASKMVLRARAGGNVSGKGGSGEAGAENAIPVCSSQASMTAAFDLLVALCTGCVQGLRSVADTLTEMYYSGEEQTLLEWEYLPAIGPRPPKGFVGLKNAGATCYMNSVIQQLFMIDAIRTYVLQVEGAADENMDELLDVLDGEKEVENHGALETHPMEEQENGGGSVVKAAEKDGERKDYNLGVLKHIQVIFAHLACSKLQYYVPRGFWKHFRLCGEAVNLREQHDAVEFFNSVVDSIDESLKTLKYKPVFSKVMGGSFADQKICKGCPHRYSREEDFTVISIDIRNQHNLLESLEQYVKGDLLEGANAYHCERCSKKVDTVKRLCIKKLPPILAIQLKRFDYDWERECAIKFNDYFEFPREVDMEPYTAQGLAKLEGEVIAGDDEDVESLKLGNGSSAGTGGMSTKYRLVGVVVHSGQASGGHYYSYILHRVGDQPPKWYKFDDGEVTECKMDDDEELKTQCFGGEYLGEVFDHMLKRMSYKRQKRWWNAYILMYERIDDSTSDTEKDLAKSMQDLTIDNRTSQVRMPPSIEKCVRRQNVQFMHNKTQFCPEYFQFMRKLLSCNTPYVQLPPGQDALSPEAEELAMISVKLASKFLFNVGFHTKKTLRGPANEWYDTLSHHLRHSKKVRLWFAQNVLFKHPGRFAEYLLECPSTEVRNAFMKIIVFLAHFSLQDGPCPAALSQGAILSEPGSVGPAAAVVASTATLSDHLLYAVLQLLKKEVSEHGRHLTQYFHLFLMYANLGACEKQQLLRLNVPATFMTVALEEGPGPPIKYQYAELGKLYAVVSQLVRCCDVSARCQSSQAGQSPLPNPHGDTTLEGYLMPIQPAVVDILYGRTSCVGLDGILLYNPPITDNGWHDDQLKNYVKKLLEDCNSSEDTGKLLKYCSWENPHFSSTVLSELLWQVAYTYTYELRPYLDLLLQMLMLEDSWQNHRIHNALKGIPEDRDGLFDTIGRSKNHYQKRAYQCIKMMVSLFTHCAPATNMLQTNTELRRKWSWAVEWLNDELERRPYSGNTQYTYNNWSPPAQSNETSNGYFLERSHSARMTLTKAFDLCPEEEEADMSTEQEGSSPSGTLTGGEVENSLTSGGEHDITTPSVTGSTPEKPTPTSPPAAASTVHQMVNLPVKQESPVTGTPSPEVVESPPKQDKDTGEKTIVDAPQPKTMEHL